jgi:hypothetical protein
MTVLIKRTQLRFVQWFKRFSEKNRPANHWYDCDTIGMH